MNRKSFSLALVAAALTRAGAVKTIGDVLSESENLRGGAQNQRHLNNADVLEAMLGKEHFDIERDECKNIDPTDGTVTYGRCEIHKFPYCTDDRPNVCFNRINRQDAFWPDKHPKYYIDYDRIHCYPDKYHNVDFTCSSCSPGRWCMPENRCILDENMYHCWNES